MERTVGPCRLFYGDPTVAAGAGMVDLGGTRGDVTVDPGVNVATGRVDQKGATPLADGIYLTGPTPVASCPLLDETKATLEEYILGASVTATALGFGSGFQKVDPASIGTLALVPITEEADGEDAAHAIWLPAAVANGIGVFTFNLPDGDDSFNPRDTQFIGALRETDQGAGAIPEDAQVMFIGPPADFGLGWTLP